MSTPYVCEPKSAQSQGLLSECLVDIPGRILRAGFHDDRQLGAEGKKKLGRQQIHLTELTSQFLPVSTSGLCVFYWGIDPKFAWSMHDHFGIGRWRTFNFRNEGEGRFSKIFGETRHGQHCDRLPPTCSFSSPWRTALAWLPPLRFWHRVCFPRSSRPLPRSP